MKYIRKIVVLVIAVALFAAAVIGAGVILAVKNVNVSLISYTYASNEDGAAEEISSYKQKFLEKIGGSVLLFVGEDSVSSVLEDGDYVMESFEKVYPCTVNITLREKRETFAVKNPEGGYSVYNEDGTFSATKENNVNSLDGAPDLLLEGVETQDDINVLVSASKNFKKAFSSLRGIASKAVLTKARTQAEKDKITFYLHTGLKIEILDCGELLFEKLEAGAAKYNALSGEDRLKGTLYCAVSQGFASATYSA